MAKRSQVLRNRAWPSSGVSISLDHKMSQSSTTGSLICPKSSLPTVVFPAPLAPVMTNIGNTWMGRRWPQLQTTWWMTGRSVAHSPQASHTKEHTASLAGGSKSLQ